LSRPGLFWDLAEHFYIIENFVLPQHFLFASAFIRQSKPVAGSMEWLRLRPDCGSTLGFVTAQCDVERPRQFRATILARVSFCIQRLGPVVLTWSKHMRDTILVTGGAGFIGSNFILGWMGSAGTQVVNLDLLTYAGNPANLSSLDGDSRYQLVRGDICSGDLVGSLLQ
jgi:hypothetical protein